MGNCVGSVGKLGFVGGLVWVNSEYLGFLGFFKAKFSPKTPQNNPYFSG